MKTSHPAGRLMLLFLAMASLTALAAPNYRPTAIAVVGEYLQRAKDPASDDEWKQYAEIRKITGQGLAAACAAALEAGREIIKDGTPADSEFFAGILSNTIDPDRPVKESVVVATPSAPPAPKPVETGDEAAQVAEGDRIALAAHRLKVTELASLLTQIDRSMAGLDENSDTWREQEKRRTATYMDLAVERQEIEVLKKKFAVQQAENARDALPEGDTKEEAGKNATQAKAELLNAQDDLAAFNSKQIKVNLGVLAKHGFSVDAGYGYFGNLRHYAPTAQIKYHFRSRLLQPGWAERGQWSNVNGKLSSLAVWIGSSMEGLEGRPDPLTGISEKENPVIAGFSAGFGNGTQSFSAMNIDAGVTLFNKPGFKDQDWYVGVSVDATLFRHLIKAFGEVAAGD